MKSISKRNQAIIQMRQKGVSRNEVADKYRLSPSRIALIEQEFESERDLAAKRIKSREIIRKVDDLDKSWAVQDLLDVMNLITVTRIRLESHFQKHSTQEITLRQLMDLAYSEIVEGGQVRLDYPLLRVYGLGKKGYWSVANELTRLDMGKKCNLEWSLRLARIKGSWRIHGETPYWKG